MKLIVLMLLCTPILLMSTVLGDSVATMSAKEWKQIPVTGEDGGACETDAGAYDGWDGYSSLMSYDPSSQKVYYIGASHHTDFDAVFFVLDIATNTVSALTPYGTGSQIVHGYNHNTMDNTRGIFYAREQSGKYLHVYNPSTTNWTTTSNSPTNYAVVAGAICYFPDIDRIVYDSPNTGEIAYYDPATGNWDDIQSASEMDGGYHTQACYLSQHNIVVLGGGNSSNTLYSLNTSKELTSIGNPGSVSLDYVLPNSTIFCEDPASGDLIMFDSGNNATYSWNPTDGWANESVVTKEPSGGVSGWGIVPIGSPYNVILVGLRIGEDVQFWIYKHAESSDSSGTNSGSILQTFYLTPDTTAINPFTLGLGFAKGATTSPTLDIDNYQIEVKRYWNDGSIKYAIASGKDSMTADTPDTINVYSGGTQPFYADLTEADIVSAAPEATVGISGRDTVALSDLLGSPVRTWLTGQEVVEAHYQQDVGDTLSVWFHVRLYSTGDVWVRAIVDNGIMEYTTNNADKSYTVTITIGDSVYTSAVTHQNNTRYAIDYWIGSSGPDMVISQDCAYLETTGLVPNYWKSATETALNSLTQSYTVLDNGDWTADMGETGFQNQIGLLPLWDALYVTSDGDSRAYNSVVANALHLNSYPIIWSDSSTNKPIRLTDYPNWSVNGDGGGGETSYSSAYVWDVAHHGSGGYLAYLITGDYIHLETMQYQAAMCYLVTGGGGNGQDTSRVIKPVQVRGVAWAHRTVGQLASLSNSDTISSQFQSQFNQDTDYWYGISTQDGMNQIGYLHAYGFPAGPWQNHFWIQTYGMMTDTEPLNDMTNLYLVRNYTYLAAVGILGPNGVDNYCFTQGGAYTIDIADGDADPTTFYDSWGVVYDSTFGSPNTSCANTLQGTSGSDPENAAQGYWGNLLPAISYAVEDTATGAYDAWTRLTGATNWSTFEASGFDDTPVWGIYPRATPQAGGGSSPSANGNGSAIAGGSGQGEPGGQGKTE